MRTLILAEHHQQTLSATTWNLLRAASHFGDDTTIVIAGFQCEAVAEQAARIQGVKHVLLANDKMFEHPLAESVSALLLKLAPDFDVIMAPATTFGKNIAPRVAAMLDVGQVSDVTAMVDHQTFIHPIYAGNAIETVTLLDDKKVLTIRPTAFTPVSGQQTACPMVSIESISPYTDTQYITHEQTQSKRPDLSSAKVIIAGGRGLQNAENFKLLEALADELGAAIGASRAAVDAGFVSNDYQIGQTGKVVAPSLYMAIGISGAVQHLAGMKDSKVIVAINKDQDAPIFQIADYGLVGDLFTIVPELTAAIKGIKAQSRE